LAGNHRATRVKERPRVSGRAAAITVVIAMVPLLWFAADRAFDGSEETPDRGALGPATSTPTVTAEPTPKPTVVPTVKPAAKPPRKPSLLRIAPAVPRRLASGTFLDVGFDDSIQPRNGSFRAASTGEVARWGTRGMPGSPGTDTVYVIGSTRADGDSAFARLPRLKPGARITIRTDRGRFTYTVASAANRPTGGLANNDDFAAKVPGRLVLVGLRVDASGDATGQAYVVVAKLTAARTA